MDWHVRLVAAMCGAEVLNMIGIFAFPALLPEFIAQWHLSKTQAGWINGIYFAGYTVAVPILASLTDRMDGRRIYLFFSAVGALATLGFGLFANGFWTAALFRTIGGLGLAGTFIPGLKALVDRIPAVKEQARAVSFYTAFFSMGTSLSFFANGELGARLGWRWAFVISAAGPLAALALSAGTLRPLPRKSPSGPKAPLLDFRPVFQNRKALAFILAYSAHTWELFAFRSWVVAFLTFCLGTSGGWTGFPSPASIAALIGLVAMWASVGGAELAMRFGRRRIITWIMWASALFAFSIGFFARFPYPALAALCILYACLVQGESAALHTGTVQTANPEKRGAAMAAQSLLGFAAASIGPIVFGMVLDVTGGGQTVFSWGISFVSMGLVAATGPVFLLIFR